HQILEDVPFDYAVDPRQIFAHDEVRPQHRTASEERWAIQEFLPQVLELETSAAALAAAVANEQHIDDRKLIEALFKRLLKVEHHNDALRQAVHDLQHPPRKPRKELKTRKARTSNNPQEIRQ